MRNSWNGKRIKRDYRIIGCKLAIGWGMINMAVFDGDEFTEYRKKYPMTYEEYEKRVIELFLELYPKEKQEIAKEIVDNALNEEPNLIKSLYGDTCFRYDHPEIYSETCKKGFEDYKLKSVPVRNLDMMIGGNID